MQYCAIEMYQIYSKKLIKLLSDLQVEVGPFWSTKIHAYGPGLEGGVVKQPAVFTVETNGEIGALGQSQIYYFILINFSS